MRHFRILQMTQESKFDRAGSFSYLCPLIKVLRVLDNGFFIFYRQISFSFCSPTNCVTRTFFVACFHIIPRCGYFKILVMTRYDLKERLVALLQSWRVSLTVNVFQLRIYLVNCGTRDRRRVKTKLALILLLLLLLLFLYLNSVKKCKIYIR